MRDKNEGERASFYSLLGRGIHENLEHRLEEE
jgi:hypothetical protein